MTFARTVVSALLAAFALNVARADDFLDRLGDALTFTAHDDTIRARARGTLDLEANTTPEPRSDLRFDTRDFLFTPRLSVFLDAQLGERLYFFAQTRADRGFDPADQSMRVRLDEFALRLAVADDGMLNVQAGKFATVVGSWSPRHHSWENPFVTAPLLYENLTGMWDSSPTVSGAHLLRRAHVVPNSGGSGLTVDKARRIPVIWGPAYGTGVAAAGAIGRFEYAAELKNAALSARPGSWNVGDRPWGAPTIGGRVGFRPNVMWNLGLSASRGTYLTSAASAVVQPGQGSRDYRQTIVGGDIAFAHHHLQCWAEFYGSRFTIPAVGDVDTFGGYVEAKYKFTPQWFGAVRANMQTFSRVVGDNGRSVRWGREIWRLDFAVIHRLSPHMHVKLQYSPQHEHPAPREFSHAVAAQFTTRF